MVSPHLWSFLLYLFLFVSRAVYGQLLKSNCRFASPLNLTVPNMLNLVLVHKRTDRTISLFYLPDLVQVSCISWSLNLNSKSGSTKSAWNKYISFMVNIRDLKDSNAPPDLSPQDCHQLAYKQKYYRLWKPSNQKIGFLASLLMVHNFEKLSI